MRSDSEDINPAYNNQTGYEGTYPPDWQARASVIRQRDEYICQDCGTKSGSQTPHGEGAVLDVHHIQPLSEGGSNRPANLTTLCIDCHNDRHAHDITEGRDDYGPPTVIGKVRAWLRRAVWYGLGSVVCLGIHVAALSLLHIHLGGTMTELRVDLAAQAYLGILLVAVFLRPRRIAVLYALVGGLWFGLTEVIVPGFTIVGMSSLTPVVTAWVPALLGGIFWWYQR